MDEAKELVAPLLPDGYFFRVTKQTSRYERRYYKVDLRRRIMWGLSVSVVAGDASYSALSVFVHMRDLKRQLDESLAKDEVVGEYPPKRVIGG